MKTLIVLAVVVLGSIGNDAFSQVRTEETRTSIDTVTGESTVTRSIILAHSEDITPRSEMVVVNPLKFFLFYNLTYYHILSPRATFGGGFQVPTISGINGFGVNAEVRLHPSGKAPRGFYVAPNISYNTLRADDSESSPFSFGVLLGWQWFPGDEFAMGLGIGVDYYIGSVSNGEGDLGNYDGTAPALRFDIGYAW